MIKIYDSSLGKYITIASNRGDKLYTKSINFQSPELPNYNDDSSIITIDEALTSMSEEIKKNKEGIAWVYKNGTIGGGGGGTGSGAPKFKVTTSDGIIENNSIIVNNNQTLNLSFTITGTSTGRKMNITIKDDKGNFYGYNNSSYTVSSQGTNVQIPNIQDNLYIEFTGYDQETLAVIESYTLNIKVSELKITAPESVEVSKSKTEYNISYNVKTTYGQSTYIKLTTKVNNTDYMYISDVFTDSRTLSFDIFNIFEGLDLENLLKNSQIDNLDIKAEAISGIYFDSVLTSVIFTSETEISVDITPITSVIEGEEPSYEYMENDNITFTVKLYFSNKEFYMYYKLYQIINDEEIIVYSKGNLDNPTDNANKISSSEFYAKNNPITIPYPGMIQSGYPVYVYVKAWDKNDQSYTGERTKWFSIKSDETWQPYNLSLSGKDVHIDGGLNYLYYEYNSKDLGNIEISDRWDSSRLYKGSSINESSVKGYIKYFNANNITNGVLLRGKSSENVNTLRLSSNAYGILYDEHDNPFKPFINNSENWMNNQEGWTISLSFKTDIQPDPNNVLFSCASFTNNGEFKEGIYITTEDVNVKFTNSTKQVNKWNLSAKLTQNTLNQVDIIYNPKIINNIKVGELRLYVNGVLAGAGIETNINFYENSYYPTILSNMTLGAGHNDVKSSYFNYCDVNFYRILVYKRALMPYHTTKNLIQGSAEINLLPDGNIDKVANNELRRKNFFTNDGKCILVDSETYTGECSPISNLYTTLSESGDNPLPIMLIKVNDAEFKNVVSNRYNEAEVAADKLLPESQKKITKEYTSVITIIKEKSNKKFIMGEQSGGLSVTNDFAGKDCTVKLQGTSTLGNKSKNYEISFGATNEQEHLVQPFDDLLPENSWIAKADVMDSGHANNAAIGGFINDFLSTYTTTANTKTDNLYASEIKATTEGHPVMMFMQYGDSGNPEFQGIYSLNLGRISYYNLGYQVFDGYYKVKSDINGEEKEVVYENHKVKDTTIEFPAYVSTYKSIPVPYTNNLAGVDSGSTTAVCYECNGNNNIVGSFQQSSADIINEFYYRVYPDIDNANSGNAFNRFRKLFVAMSNLYECDPEYLCKLEEGDEYLKTRSLYTRNSKGEFFNNETGLYETFNKNNISLYKLQEAWNPADFYESLTTPQTNENENFVGLNWNFASAYFTLAMLFGLTDSLGKNLNIRSFNLSDWYISFYDMDTGLGLTNSGYETVKKDVYLDTFAMNSNGREIDVKINGYNEGGYDTRNSRLFNIIRFFTNKAYPNTGMKPSINYRKIWENIRKTILRNPDDFINNYYIKQNKDVGEILFNYDYDIKYVNDELDIIINPSQNGTTSINFLHGNRVNFVRDWFTKHVYFLDGVFDIKCNAPLTNETTELYGNAAGSGYYGLNSEGNITTDSNFTAESENVECPYISFSVQNDRVNPSFDGYKLFKVKANMPLFFVYNNGTLNQRLYIPENKETNVQLYFKSGNEQTMSFNYVPYLITFDKFGTLSYTNISSPNLALLNELDLSDTKTLSGAQFDISKLVELRKLNMNNTKITGSKKLSVNLQNAKKISYIDLRDADVEDLTLPGYGNNPGGALEQIYIDNTNIKNVDLTGHAMLKTFSANGCEELEAITFKYNNELTSIGTIPSTVKTLEIDECNALQTLSLSNMEKLSDDTFKIGHLENLKSFTYNPSTEAENGGLSYIDLSGCPNIETINLSQFNGTYIILNENAKSTLRTVNFAYSNISYIIWKNENGTYKSYIDNNYEYVLDFIDCDKINNINIAHTDIKYLLLNESVTPILNILSCTNLTRIVGNISISNISMFQNLSNFRFNEICKYDEYDDTSHIILNDDGEVELDDTTLEIYTLNGDDRYYNLNYMLTHYKFNVIDNPNCEKAFMQTGINVTDLYAILYKLKNKNIDKLDGTFINCKNIKTFNLSYTTNAVGSITSVTYNSKYLAECYPLKYDLFDGYNNITILKDTFSGCENINGPLYKIDDIDSKSLESVISISNNESSILSRNSIFYYLDNLTELSGTFNGCGKLIIHDYLFYKNSGTPDTIQYSNIKKINAPFSSNTTHCPVVGSYGIMLGNFFAILKNLEHVENLFFNTNVQLNVNYIGDSTSILMFHNNPNLKYIERIFSDYWWKEFGSFKDEEILLYDVFGGYSYKNNPEFEYNVSNTLLKNLKVKYDTYPRNIEHLNYAFAVNNIAKNKRIRIVNWDNMDNLFANQEIVKVNNKNTISLLSCDYMFDKLAQVKVTNNADNDDDGYYNYTTDSKGTLAKFPLNLFNIKTIDGEDVWFSNLTSCEGLFMRSAFKDELKFPGNIFKYCDGNKLNLSHLLEDTVMTPIKLVNINDTFINENGDEEYYSCFTNCKLGNVSSMFKNCFKSISKDIRKESNYETNYEKTYYKYDRGGLHGIIPYKFFMNATNNISDISNIFEGCCNLGVNIDLICDENGDYVSGYGDFLARNESNFYNIRKPSLDDLHNFVNNNDTDYSKLLDLVDLDDNSNYIWNQWSYDGTIFDNEYLELLNQIKLNGLTYSEAKHINIPNYIDLEWLNIDNDNNIIEPSESIIDNFEYCKFTNENQKESLKNAYYDASYLGNKTINDITIPIYRIYYDADYDVKNRNFDISLLNTNQLWNCDSVTYIDKDDTAQLYKHEYYSDQSQNATKFISNYMCPMDLFRYCNTSCKVNGVFKNLSRFNNDDKRDTYNDYVYGLIGRIPPKLFDKLTGTLEFNEIFENYKGLAPYSQSIDGMFYNFMFKYNINMTHLTNSFKGIMLLGHISDLLFNTNIKLKNISGIFRYGYMPKIYAQVDEYGIDYQNLLSNNTFSKCISLENMAYAFEKNNIISSYDYYAKLYFDINSGYWTTKNNPNLIEVNNMFTFQNSIQRNDALKSDFCDFTQWRGIRNSSSCYTGANFDLDIIPESLGGNKK